MANTLLLWKGAVEPNDLGAASGNELIMSKGSVQSARSYVAASSSGGPSISDGITRPVTGNITRLVTERSFFY